MMRFSWIITLIGLYTLAVLFYILRDLEGVNQQWWSNYYWLVNAGLSLISLTFNWMDKTNIEWSFLYYLWTFRAITILYFIVSVICGVPYLVMNGYIDFFIMLSVSSFVGLIFYHKRYGKVNK